MKIGIRKSVPRKQPNNLLFNVNKTTLKFQQGNSLIIGNEIPLVNKRNFVSIFGDKQLKGKSKMLSEQAK